MKGIPRFFRWAPLAASAVIFGCAGCASVGPRNLRSDPVDYARALGEANKRMIVATVVGLHFADTPASLALTQVIAAYNLDATGALTVNSRTVGVVPLQVAGNAAYSNHPTFTFAPTAGEAYASSFVRPLPAALVLPLAETGVPIDLLLRIVAQSIAGRQNAEMLAGPSGSGSPEFFELLHIMRRLQLAGAAHLVYRNSDGGHMYLVLGKNPAGAGEDFSADLSRAREILGAAASPDGYPLVVTGGRPGEVEIATRSVLGILSSVGASVLVPEDVVARGATFPTVNLVGGESRPIVKILAGAKAPGDAYVAVEYTHRWYWIDANDFDSKYALTVIQEVMALAQVSDTSKNPLVTIPAGE